MSLKSPKSLLAVLLITVAGLNAQTAFNTQMPLEFREAYHKGTRSITGTPGQKYWQNSARYQIEAELLHSESLLKGREQVVYFNNSPDTLDKIVIRLYQNIYKKGNSRQFSLGEDAVNDGMVLHSLSLGDKEVDLNDRTRVRTTPTNLSVGLEELLMPGDSLTMEVSWQYAISEKRPIRTGNYGDERFFIAYWYPQIAVYDDIDGWDMIDYAGVVEFYNDCNDFNVEIATTEGFLVWATGTLENMDEIYKGSVLENYEKTLLSDDIHMIFTADDCRNDKVLKKKDRIKWEYKAKAVPDFSFAAARLANWEGSSLLVDENTGRRVLVDAVYGDSPRTFDHTAEQSRRSVEYMSSVLPGYPFPYTHMTTFNNGRNGGGMETPMMANNGDPSGLPNASGTIFHEIAHTYFPFFMGINEKKYAWMDEGWAAFLPIGFMDKYFPDYNYLARTVTTFEYVNGKGIEMRQMDLSYGFGNHAAYRHHAYTRPALAYHFLHDALGDSVFKLCLSNYLESWNGKHPSPYDFFNSFVNTSGQRLGWFFYPWFFDRSYADLGIKKVTLDNKVVVENIGGLPLPVVVKCEYTDGSVEIFRENTAIWASGDPAVILQVNTEKEIKKVELGTDLIPDINNSNNTLLPHYE